jgi:alkanesulfonate monooxygenase
MRPPEPVPGVYFGGSSAVAGPVAARHVDTYLTWGEPPAQVAGKLAWIRGLASSEGRTPRFRYSIVIESVGAGGALGRVLVRA